MRMTNPPQYPNPQPSPYQPPPKKRKKWPWIVGIIAVLVIIIAVSTSGGDDKKSDDTASVPSATGAQVDGKTTAEEESDGDEGTVVYEVESDSGSAGTITYFGEGGNQSQANGESLPWRSKPLDKDETTIKGVTAQNGGGGEITCRIIVDGKVEAENTSSGQYAVVSCNGDLF